MRPRPLLHEIDGGLPKQVVIIGRESPWFEEIEGEANVKNGDRGV